MTPLRETGPHSCPTCGQDVSHAPNHVSEEELAAIIGGQGVVLTRHEAVILHLLLKHSPRVVSYERIIQNVYPDPDDEPDNARNVVDVHLWRLAKKLHGIAYIEPVRGAGRRLVAQ